MHFRSVWALSAIITLVVSWRILEIILVMFRVTLYNRRHPGGSVFYSFDRSVVLGLINYLELIICFGAMYGCWSSYLDKVRDIWDPIYFSFITIATVGYGDLKPTGGLRLAASLETIIGILLLVFILGRFVPLITQGDVSLDSAPIDKGESKS